MLSYCYWFLLGMRSFFIIFFWFYLLILSCKTDCSWLLFVNSLSFKDIYKYESFFVDCVPVGWLGLRLGLGYKDCRVKYWLFEGCCLSQLPSVNTCWCLVLLLWIYCFSLRFSFSLAEIFYFISLIFLYTDSNSLNSSDFPTLPLKDCPECCCCCL